MKKMSWDDEVAMIAQKWADTCRVGRGESHDKVRFIPGRFTVGQNIGLGGGLTVDTSMTMWWDEYKIYTFGKSYIDHSREGKMIGHYTQMAWADTYKIGCGQATCNGLNIVVCNYAPAGNVIPFTGPYKKPGSSETVCGDCKTCSNNLCDCGGLECGLGKLNVATCQCECTLGNSIAPFLKQPDCRLDCSEGDLWFCGQTNFDDCTKTYVVSYCPHQCNVCPHANAV